MLAAPSNVAAQIPPSAEEAARYSGLHAAVHRGDAVEVRRLLAAGADVRAVDGSKRTALHVAAFRGDVAIARALVVGGADPRALEAQHYDAITIAAVRNDVPFLRAAIEIGCDPRAVTSPYEGTALIAAAHLGHDEVVATLVAAGAPLDHVNNLGWTALIEAVVLGDGGPRHQACARLLLAGGANPNIADRQGKTPLRLARDRGFAELARLIETAGGQ